MRFLHTADWHLGRLFHGLHLTQDQAHLLDQLVDLARRAQVQAVLISGDVYDRSVPPVEAVELFDHTLERLAREVGVAVVAIAGNHDSAQRLGFGARLMEASGVSVTGLPSARPRPVVLDDEHGPVAFLPLAYADPAVARQVLDDPGLGDHQAALTALAARARAAAPAGARTVLLAHAFVAGGLASESERPLSLGGAEVVDASVLAGFDYVALGHLHRAQQVGGPAMAYAGSLMPYSFSEAGAAKTVSLVEMDAQGGVTVERVELTPRHSLRVVEGELDELLAGPPSGVAADDYLMVRLTDPGALYEPMGRLRRIYPNLLHLERVALALPSGDGTAGLEQRKLGLGELFAGFFQQVEGRELSPEESAALAKVLERVHTQEGEA